MSLPRTVCVVTGSRSEYGLLRPVMRAIEAHDSLELQVIVCGEHAAAFAGTAAEVLRDFPRAVELEAPGSPSHGDGRLAHAERFGAHVGALSREFGRRSPDVVVVLGDRVEAFAAAAAGGIGGVRIAHMHGGDRAEGIADESMRHAITKLAHIHLPATRLSASRIERMGEDASRIHVVGSPAVEGLESVRPLADHDFNKLGSPDIIFLMHPAGSRVEEEESKAASVLRACATVGRVLALEPNYDPGRDALVRAIRSIANESNQVTCRAHLPREMFMSLLKRVSVIVGNSSAGLIESAALGTWAINVGPRQAGRERAGNTIDIAADDEGQLEATIRQTLEQSRFSGDHPYGAGDTGPRTAEILAGFDPCELTLRKRNTY